MGMRASFGKGFDVLQGTNTPCGFDGEMQLWGGKGHTDVILESCCLKNLDKLLEQLQLASVLSLWHRGKDLFFKP